MRTASGKGAPAIAPDGTSELNDLVARCVDRFDAEGDAALEGLCREHPAHADKLRSRVRALQRAGLIGGAPEPGSFPERLGEFRLLRYLGGGGMGAVYLAVQEPLGREVALKLVRPDQLYFPGARERFRREVELVAKLQHPGIVPVYTFGEEQGLPYFAMERVQGCTLGEVLRELVGQDPSRLEGADLVRAVKACAARNGAESSDAAAAGTYSGSWIEACARIAQQTARALQHAHACGVLHRDVKPSNLMLRLDGRVLLMDFGLATSEGTSRITRTGSQLGSLPYMAPEQLRGEPADARTDVYALGVTLYELLALAPPHLEETADATLQAILRGEPRRPSDRNRAVPWDVETVCLTAMESDRSRRYASAGAFARDLDNLLALRPIEARRASSRLRARRWMQRHPTASVAAALGFLLLVVAPSVAWWRIKEQRDLALVELGARQGMFDFLLDVIGAASHSKTDSGELPSLEEAIDEGTRRIREELRDYPEVRMGLLGNFAAAQSRLGRPREAVALYEEALELARAHGDEHRSVLLTCQQSLAVSLIELGEFERGERVLRELREDVVASGGARHVTLWSIDSNLISLLLLQRRFEEVGRDPSAPVHEDGNERIAWLTESAEVEKGLGLLDEATAHLAEAVETASRVWGRKHVETARRIQNLAALHADRGQAELALPLLEEVRAIRADARAPESLDDARLAGNLAATYNRLGRVPEALASYQRSLELCRKLSGDSAQTARAASGTGAMLVKLERLDEAEQVLREAVDLSRRFLPRRGLTGGEAPLWLGRCLARQGRAEEALPLFEEVLECTHADPSVPSNLRVKYEAETADLLDALGRADEAAALRTRAQ
jgi:serine/threonine protein kinase/tetratricopeptide (TPR) repeat protein